MPRSKSHRNTTRLTAKERAAAFVETLALSSNVLERYRRDVAARLQREFAAHARETLDRFKRREAKTWEAVAEMRKRRQKVHK